MTGRYSAVIHSPIIPLRLVAFRFDDELIEGMRALQARDGVQPAEIARRAVRRHLEERGMLKKADRKRASTRKRS